MPIQVINSQRYNNLVNFAASFITYLTTHMVRLEVTQAQIDVLTPLKTELDTVHSLYTDELTRTRAVNMRMEAAAVAIEHAISALQRDIETKTTITLTDDDVVALRLTVREAGSRHPVPGESPRPDVRKTAARYVEFEFTDTDEGKTNNRGLPSLVDGVVYTIAMLPPGTEGEPEANLYSNFGESSRSIHRVYFSEANRGAVGWIKAHYVNRRREAGPESNPVKFDII